MPTKNYIFKTFGDDEPIEATVHYNEGTSGPRPIALAIHGGGYSMGSKDMIPQPQIDYLGSNGLVVVSVDHRLCPQVSVADGPAADTRDAYHWCRDVLPDLLKRDVGIDADGSRVVVFGHSSGAHLALLLGLESPRPRAVLDFYGTLYLSDEWWTKPATLSFPELPREFMDKVFDEPTLTSSSQGAAARAKDEASGIDCRTAWAVDKMRTATLVSTLFAPDYDSLDPAARWGSDFPPTFFAHGAADNLVSVELSKRGLEALRALGVEAEMSITEGGGHGYDGEIKEGDEAWENGVQKGLDFLIAHA